MDETEKVQICFAKCVSIKNIFVSVFLQSCTQVTQLLSALRTFYADCQQQGIDNDRAMSIFLLVLRKSHSLPVRLRLLCSA
jgi:hypothetical protein